MLQAHSLLWHYLWVGPQVLQLGLGLIIWGRGLHRRFPAFFIYIVFEALEELILYTLDVVPRISDHTFWMAFCIGLILEALITFALVGELFRHLLGPWTALARIGNRLICWVGTVLVALAVLAAAYAPIDNPQFAIVSRAHILEQTFYIIQCGLILFLFVFAAHFELAWDRRAFGIAIGFGLVWCENMAAWAVAASGAFISQRYLLDFLNMATYHLSVLIWFYFLLVPQKIATTSAAPLPENNLELWNRELERLLQP